MKLRLAVPGRTELAGNHTDHQGGRVLAAAVELYLRAEAETVPGREVLIRSEGFGELRVDLDALAPVPGREGSAEALAGEVIRLPAPPPGAGRAEGRE